MKKIVVFVVVLVLALAIGAWAKELGNGITYTDERPMASQPAPGAEPDQYVEGSSAGGLRPEKTVYNGITHFTEPMPATQETEPAAVIYNGITKF